MTAGGIVRRFKKEDVFDLSTGGAPDDDLIEIVQTIERGRRTRRGRFAEAVGHVLQGDHSRRQITMHAADAIQVRYPQLTETMDRWAANSKASSPSVRRARGSYEAAVVTALQAHLAAEASKPTA